MNAEENKSDINSLRERTYRRHLERINYRSTAKPNTAREEVVDPQEEDAEYVTRTVEARTQTTYTSTPQKTQRISAITATLLVWLALFFDGSQFLLNLVPILGNFLSMVFGFFAWLSFYVWLKTKGVQFSGIKKGGTLIGAAIIELVPVVNAIPAWTFAILILIAVTKAEDATGAKIPRKLP